MELAETITACLHLSEGATEETPVDTNDELIAELAEEISDIEEMLSFDEFAAKIRKGNPKAKDAGLKKMYAAYKSKVKEALDDEEAEDDIEEDDDSEEDVDYYDDIDSEDDEDDEDAVDEAVKRRSLKSRVSAARTRKKPMDAKRKAKAKAAKKWRQKNKAKVKSYKRRYKAPVRSIEHRESVKQTIRDVAEGGDVHDAINRLIEGE